MLAAPAQSGGLHITHASANADFLRPGLRFDGHAHCYFVHRRQSIDERAVMHTVDLGAEHHEGDDFYYQLQELDTVAAVLNHRGAMLEGYGYDAYGKMWGSSFNPADFNASGMVGLDDYTLYAAGVGEPTNDPPTDLNDDGKTTNSDFSIFSVHFGMPSAPIAAGLVGSDHQFTGRAPMTWREYQEKLARGETDKIAPPEHV